MDWLEAHQPRLHRDARRQARTELQDFAFFRHFSYGCKQVFSARPLGAHRRGGPVPRPVLFAGQRLHRDRQHLHRELIARDRAGRAARRARAALRPDLPLVLREHADALHATSTRSSATPRCCRSRCSGTTPTTGACCASSSSSAGSPTSPRWRALRAELAHARRSTSRCRRSCAPGRRRGRGERRQPGGDARPGRRCRGSPSSTASLLDRLDDAAFRERIRARRGRCAPSRRRSPSAPRRAPASPRRRCARLLAEDGGGDVRRRVRAGGAVRDASAPTRPGRGSRRLSLGRGSTGSRETAGVRR